MDASSTTSPVITLTESAAAEVKNILAQPENAGKTLRIFVEQGGCSGMQYSMVFDEKRADDSSAEMHGVSVLVDPFSAKYLQGTVVDPQGASVPGATVTVTSKTTGAAKTATSDSSGRYEIPFVLPDTYRIVVEAKESGTAIAEAVVDA